MKTPLGITNTITDPHFCSLLEEAINIWSPNFTQGSDITLVERTHKFPVRATMQYPPYPILGTFDLSNTDNLLAIIIHELGHALGLPHSLNPLSVMHPQSTNTKLHPRDKRRVPVPKLHPPTPPRPQPRFYPF